MGGWDRLSGRIGALGAGVAIALVLLSRNAAGAPVADLKTLRTTGTVERLERRDVEVLDAVARRFRTGRNGKPRVGLVLPDRTPQGERHWCGDLGRSLGKTTEPLVQALRVRGEGAFRLEETTRTEAAFLLGWGHYLRLRDSDALRTESGDVEDYVCATLPGYAADGRHAMVYLVAWSGGDDGFASGWGDLYRLELRNGRWEVVEVREEWIT